MTGATDKIPCLSIAGEAALKPIKTFICCLNSSHPAPQVPWPNSAICLLLKAIGSLCPSVSSSTGWPHNFHGFSPALLSDEAGRFFQQVELCLRSFAWVDVGVATAGYS